MRHLIRPSARRAFTAVESVVALMGLTILAALIWLAVTTSSTEPAVRDAPAPGQERGTRDDEIPVIIGGTVFWM